VEDPEVVAKQIKEDLASGDRSDAAAVPTNTTSVISIIKQIYDVVAALTSYFLTLTETGATRTTDGTEQNVYINNAPAGVFTPKMLNIDFTNQTATETVVLREYYRIKSGGAYVLQDEVTFVGVQDPELIHVTLKDNRFGIKVTIEKTAGTNRAYDYEVVSEI
jgi:hypothetical protein